MTDLANTAHFTPGMITPTGAQHEVGVDKLFFSTTDSRGVIEQANSVFVELSHWSRADLVGAPHNIIRHPMMPGGAFKVMWDTIGNSKPFAAYVHNLAHNGSRYDVFATITPLDGGYLSVRTRPMCTDLFGVVDSLYADVLNTETEARQAGASRHEAAVVGAERLAKLISDAGIRSYRDFILDALPLEVEARETEGTVLPNRPNATGELAEMLRLVALTHEQLSSSTQSLTKLKGQSDALLEGAEQLLEVVNETAEVSKNVQALPTDSFEQRQLIMPLQLWSAMDAEVRTLINQLLDDLRETSNSANETRFQIALARLHATMLGNFVAELIDAHGQDESSPAIGLLARAIADGTAGLNAQTSYYADHASQLTNNIEQVAGLMQMLIDLLGAWATEAKTRSLPSEVATMLPQIEKLISDAENGIAKTRSLGVLLTDKASLPDAQALNDTVSKMQVIASHFGKLGR